jgi:type I restriction enzyme M protein
MLDAELKSKINHLWDKFWSGGISNPLQAIEQISYLIFMKRLENEDIRREKDSQLTGEEFKSIFENNKDCKWSIWTQYSADKILDHIRDIVFPFLRNLGEEDSLYKKYMKDSSFTIPTASLLIEAVKIINDMHIKEQNRDAQGDLYEYLLSELKTAGKNGQFRTPRHIIKMMTEIVNPQFGDNVLDPACGTAGFLVMAYEHILKNNTSKDLIKIDEEGNEYNFKADKLNPKQKKILEENTLFGFDIDPVMTRVSLMNLMMHGITKPNIEQENTLSKGHSQNEYFDIILANPPFKGSIDESELSDEFRTTTKKTELLFLELMYNSLNHGGKCGVIVPDGVLFGNSKAHKSTRQRLLEKCSLDAVISMPSGVFKPYAGVSTAILFFTKGQQTKKVWFYDMENDGFSLDDKRTEIDKNDIPDIIEKFKKRNEESNDDRKKKNFFIPFEEIKENNYDLSISKYKEREDKEIKYEPPEKIKKKIIELEKNITKALIELKLE